VERNRTSIIITIERQSYEIFYEAVFLLSFPAGACGVYIEYYWNKKVLTFSVKRG
jgi:hypothetical protein